LLSIPKILYLRPLSNKQEMLTLISPNTRRIEGYSSQRTSAFKATYSQLRKSGEFRNDSRHDSIKQRGLDVGRVSLHQLPDYYSNFDSNRHNEGTSLLFFNHLIFLSRFRSLSSRSKCFVSCDFSSECPIFSFERNLIEKSIQSNANVCNVVCCFFIINNK